MNPKKNGVPVWVWWLLGSLAAGLILSKFIGPAGFFFLLILPFGAWRLFRSKPGDRDEDR